MERARVKLPYCTMATNHVRVETVHISAFQASRSRGHNRSMSPALYRFNPPIWLEMSRIPSGVNDS